MNFSFQRHLLQHLSGILLIFQLLSSLAFVRGSSGFIIASLHENVKITVSSYLLTSHLPLPSFASCFLHLRSRVTTT
ncbi:hypothetical protein BD408DRAFT_427102 [Parasitella parasitica]|nr:hypothetical protein BD408DRAFT_427102 [Parasitella parasitica]